MDPATGAVVGGLIGGGIDAVSGILGNQSANSAARVMRHWNERMSNTAVQRRSADLRAAGINPLLAAGDPASSPVVGPAQTRPPLGEAGSRVAQGVQTAAQLKLQQASVASQIQLNSAQAAKAMAEAQSISGPQTEHHYADIARLNSMVDNIAADTSLKGVHAKVAEQEAVLKNMEANKLVFLLPYMQEKLEAEMKLAKAGVPAAEKRAEAWRSLMGTAAAYAELATPMVNSAAQAVGAAGLGRWLKGGGLAKPGAKTPPRKPNLGTERLRDEFKRTDSYGGKFDKDGYYIPGGN